MVCGCFLVVWCLVLRVVVFVVVCVVCRCCVWLFGVRFVLACVVVVLCVLCVVSGGVSCLAVVV